MRIQGRSRTGAIAPRFVVFLAAASVLASCGDSSREIQEWSPEDHQGPEGPVDAERPGPTTHGGAADEAQIAAMAAEVFRRECAGCHGAEGRGDGAEAPAAMPDMTSAEFHEDREDADLLRSIRMGQGLMPAFGNQFNELGIAALVAHVRSLRSP